MDEKVVSLEAEKFTAPAIRAVISQVLGYFFDAYDLLIVLSLATVLNRVFLPPNVPVLLSQIAILSGFVLSEVVRPLGSFVFGHYADKLGRKITLIITVIGYSVSGALVAALPSYTVAGYLGFIIYLILRFLVGFFMGGEYAGGHTLAMEWTPPKWRGLVSGLILFGFILGGLANTVAIYYLSLYFGSNFVTYGWRYLILTTLIPLPIALFIRLRVEDSPMFKEVVKNKQVEKLPVKSVLGGKALKDFIQILIVMTGMFLASFASYSNLLLVLQNKPSILSYGNSLIVYMIGLVGGGIGAIIYGHLSQIFGRKYLGTRWHIATILLAIPIYYVIINSATVNNIFVASLFSFILVFLAYAPWGSTVAYLAERYRTSHRSSGVGIGFSSGLFIGGWYTFYTLGLHSLLQGIEVANIWLSSGILLIIAGLLVIIGFKLGPETKGISLAK